MAKPGARAGPDIPGPARLTTALTCRGCRSSARGGPFHEFPMLVAHSPMSARTASVADLPDDPVGTAVAKFIVELLEQVSVQLHGSDEGRHRFPRSARGLVHDPGRGPGRAGPGRYVATRATRSAPRGVTLGGRAVPRHGQGIVGDAQPVCPSGAYETPWSSNSSTSTSSVSIKVACRT